MPQRKDNLTWLARQLYDRSPVTVTQANDAIHVIFDSIIDAMLDGERTIIKDFGSFVVREHKGYVGKSDLTGLGIVRIPVKKGILFRASPVLKKMINL